jgi:hypothetical protein
MDRFLEADRIAEAAVATVAESDGRITAFNAAHSAWRSNRVFGAPEERRLTVATQALTSFDRARISPVQARALTEAAELAADLSGSERRLDDVAAALAAARADPGAPSNRLLDAFGALRDVDRQRADNQQRATINAAADLTREVALSRLAERSITFRNAPNDPAAALSLVRLQPALAGIDPMTLTAEQRDAFSDIDRAAAKLRDSDRRIAAVERAMQSFQNARSRATGSSLLQALGDVSDFDRRRLTAPQTATFERATVAASVVRAPQVPRDRWAGEVSVFIAVPVGNDGQVIAARVQRAITEAGFRIAPSRDAAGLIVVVEPPQLGQPEAFQIGGLENVSISGTISARILWGIDETPAGQGFVRQWRGIGMVESDARRNALHNASERIAESSVMALR